MKPLGGIALSLVVAVSLSACGSSESGASSQPETSEQAAGSSTTVAAPPKESYSGLGSKAAVFSASNEGKPSPNPPAGNTWYTVLSTDSAGRVTAFRMEENDEPALEPRERVGFLGGNILPPGARQTNLNGEECIVWRSPTLKRLVGMEYAASTTGPEESSSAEMRAESSPSCHGASAREAKPEGEGE